MHGSGLAQPHTPEPSRADDDKHPHHQLLRRRVAPRTALAAARPAHPNNPLLLRLRVLLDLLLLGLLLGHGFHLPPSSSPMSDRLFHLYPTTPKEHDRKRPRRANNSPRFDQTRALALIDLARRSAPHCFLEAPEFSGSFTELSLQTNRPLARSMQSVWTAPRPSSAPPRQPASRVRSARGQARPSPQGATSLP